MSLYRMIHAADAEKYSIKHFSIARKRLEQEGFIIYGAGFHTQQVVLPALLQANLHPDCILDADERKVGQTLCGIPVAHVSSLSSLKEKPVLLSSCSLLSMITVCESFGHNDWIVPRAIAPFCWTTGELGMHISEFLAREDDIERAYARFKDPLSQRLFQKTFRYHLLLEPASFDWEVDIYFPSDLRNSIDYSHMIDVGAYDGDTLISWKNQVFSDSCTDYSYTAFEPSPKSYTALAAIKDREFPGDDKIATFQMAAGAQRGEVLLVGANTPSTTVTQGTTRSGGINIPITTIDDTVLKKTTCIKADIEGGELALLHGAEKTIQRDRPALLISAYHRRFDCIELTDYIDSLDLGYSFFLRHHTPAVADTVCYMIPQN